MKVKKGDFVAHRLYGLCAVKDISLVGGLAVCLQPLTMEGMRSVLIMYKVFGFPFLEMELDKFKVIKQPKSLPYILAQRSEGGWDVLAWSDKYDLEDMELVKSFATFEDANNFCLNNNQ